MGDYQKGENVLFVRSDKGVEVLRGAMEAGYLDVRPIDWNSDKVRRDTDYQINLLKRRRAYTLFEIRQAKNLPLPDFSDRVRPSREVWSKERNRRVFSLLQWVKSKPLLLRLAKHLPARAQYWLGVYYMGAEIDQPWLLTGEEKIEKRIQ